MLILSRKFNESFIIDGHIMVKVVRLDGDVVKLGIDAPMDVPVHREEIFAEIRRNNREALLQSREAVPRLNAAMFSAPSVTVPVTPSMPSNAFGDAEAVAVQVKTSPKSKVRPAVPFKTAGLKKPDKTRVTKVKRSAKLD